MLKYLAFALILIQSPIARADHPAVHGMLLFGKTHTYASHLPMFHAPHNYQALLELSISDLPGGSAAAIYANVKQTSQDIFTIAPEPMDLSAILDGSQNSFLADLYQGHFERGGINLGKVSVKVEKVIFSAKLKAQASGNPSSYLAFGSNGEYFAAHMIDGKPNFDAILSVSQPYTSKDPPCHFRSCKIIVEEIPDSQLPVEVKANPASKLPYAMQLLGEYGGVNLTVWKVLYLEEDELQ